MPFAVGSWFARCSPDSVRSSRESSGPVLGASCAFWGRRLNGLRETYQALGTPGATVASGIQKMKDAAIAIANDPNGITKGDCSNLISEVASYFDRAASAVA